MAATDYFAPGTRPSLEQQNSGLYAPPPPQRSHSSQPGYGYQPQPGHPSPQFGGVRPPSPYAPPPPPPYQPLNNLSDPKVRFAQGPQTPLGQHRPSLSDQSPYALNQPNFQASQAQLSPYPPGQYVPYQQAQPYSQSNHRPSHRPSYSEQSRSGYSSDPEQHRHKHRDRTRRVSEHSRSTNSDGFLGAAGGGLIGDLIFPGLGTVGGALVGWLGGKDYGKHRKWREDKREKEEEQWQKKYHRGSTGGSDRSRSHSRDDRDDREGDVGQRRRTSHIGHDGLVHSHLYAGSVPRRTSHEYREGPL